MTDEMRTMARVLAPAGGLVAAINFGNQVLAQRDPATGRPRGVTADLAEDLGRILGVPVSFRGFDRPGDALVAVKEGACDIGFLAIEPARAAEVCFTAPYVLIEGTYAVPDASPLRAVEEVDRDGVRIAVGDKAAYDLYLSRTLKQATLVRAANSLAALEMFLAEELEAAAGVRQALASFFTPHPGVRIMDGAFMTIRQAMCIPRGREAGEAFAHAFIEERKASGFVAAALMRSGQGDATVAPAEAR